MIKNILNFKNKKVLITGFNGFKGTWLTLWLYLIGAKIYGIALKENSKENHFNLIKKKINIKYFYIDIRNYKKIDKKIQSIKPDFVFHLAAQAIVSESVRKPRFNWETNVIGFLNILMSLKNLNKKCTAVMITSDKCYKNFEKKSGYKENDILGGEDPYSASKASAEILFYSFYKTYVYKKNRKLRVATARAGNVVGGGDWSKDRLIPDCMRSWLKNKKVIIRNPKSTRPWQHVLEAVYGYLVLASNLSINNSLNGQSFNFSSNQIKNVDVSKFLSKIKILWPEVQWSVNKKKKFYESSLLQLNNQKSKKLLNWSARLKVDETVTFLVDWYKSFQIDKKNIFDTSANQIKIFQNKIND